MLRAMITSCTTVSRIDPAVIVAPWLIEYETFVGPAIACVPNTRIRVIPSETITIPIGEVPRALERRVDHVVEKHRQQRPRGDRRQTR